MGKLCVRRSIREEWIGGDRRKGRVEDFWSVNRSVQAL